MKLILAVLLLSCASIPKKPTVSFVDDSENTAKMWICVPGEEEVLCMDSEAVLNRYREQSKPNTSEL